MQVKTTQRFSDKLQMCKSHLFDILREYRTLDKQWYQSGNENLQLNEFNEF